MEQNNRIRHKKSHKTATFGLALVGVLEKESGLQSKFGDVCFSRQQLKMCHCGVLPMEKKNHHKREDKKLNCPSPRKNCGFHEKQANSLYQQRANNHPLNLTGPLVNFRDLGITHHALYRKISGVTITTMDLYRLGRHLHRRFTGKELSHR